MPKAPNFSQISSSTLPAIPAVCPPRDPLSFGSHSAMTNSSVVPSQAPLIPRPGSTTNASIASLPNNPTNGAPLNPISASLHPPPSSRVGSVSSQSQPSGPDHNWPNAYTSRRNNSDTYDEVRGTVGSSHGSVSFTPDATSAQIDARVQRLLDGDLSPEEGQLPNLIPSPESLSPEKPSPLHSRHLLDAPPKSKALSRDLMPDPSLDERPNWTLPTRHQTTTSTVTPTLNDIASLQRQAQLLRLQNRMSKSRLHRRLVSLAIGNRVYEHSSAAYRRLAYFYSREDKRAFSGIASGIVAMKESWESIMGIGYNHGLGLIGDSKPKTWISDLPPDIQVELFGLINLVRSDPAFLSTCISSLTTTELLSLVTSRADSGSQLGGASGGGSATSQALNNALKGGRAKGGSTAHSGDVLVGEKGAVAALDRLVGLGRSEAYSTLLSNVFGPGEAENRLKLTTWAGVCARLLVSGREGWQKVVSACFDAWAGVELECTMSGGVFGSGKLNQLGKAFGVSLGSGWGARKAVEGWLMALVEQGKFLEFEKGQQPDPQRVDKFFDNAITELFDIVTREGGFPTGAVEFGSALLKAVGALTNLEHKRGEALYQISEWFLRTFLPSVIWNPERAGMLLGVWISKSARTVVLRELVARLSIRVSVSSGKNIPEVRKRVETMVRRYSGVRDISTAITSSQVKPYVVLCPSDVVTIINALFPERKSGGNTFRAGMTGTTPTESILPPRAPISAPEVPAEVGTPPIFVSNRTGSIRSRNVHSSAASVGSIGSTGSASTTGGGSGTLPLPSSAHSGSGFPSASGGYGLGQSMGLTGSLGGGPGGAGLRARPVSGLVSVASQEAAGVFARPFDRPERSDKAREKKDRIGSSGEPERVGTDRNPFFPQINFDSTMHAASSTPIAPLNDCPRSPNMEKAGVAVPSTDTYVRRMQALVKALNEKMESSLDGCRTFAGPSEKRTASNLCHPCAETWAILNVRDGLVVNEQDLDNDSDPDEEGEEEDSVETKEGEAFIDEEDPKEGLDCEAENSAGIAATPDQSVLSVNSQPNPGQQPSFMPQLQDFDYQFVRSVILELTRSGILSNLTCPTSGRRSILSLLEQAYKLCVRRDEWMPAHRLHQVLIHLRKIAPSSLGRDDYSALIRMLCRGVKETVDDLESVATLMKEWEVWVGEAEKSARSRLEEITRLVGRLRGKLWYTADVQASAVYEEVRSVAVALKAMGDADVDNDAPVEDGGSNSKPNQRPEKDDDTGIDWTAKLVKSKGLAPEHGFLVQTDSQVLGLLAAPVELGGPRKLSDAQAQITSGWLKTNRVERFCRGEERVFRLSLEISKAVGRLVGEGMLDGPVLWSSELYERERRKWWESSSGVGHSQSNPSHLSHGAWNAGGNHTPGQNGSSGGYNTPIGHAQPVSNTAGTPHGSFFGFRFKQSDVDFVTDSPEVRSGSGVASIAEWCPFDSWKLDAAEYESVGTTGFRNSNAREKSALLADLRRQLTGLMISDVGGSLFWDGSELDRWLRSGRVTSIQKQMGVDTTTRALLPRRPTDLHAVTAPDAPADFPFESAFRRILARFSSDPDPAEKLAALHVLEQVVLAYLMTPCVGSSRVRTQPDSSSAPVSAEVSPALTRPAQGISANSMPSADLIVDMLQSIFRDPSITPRTLFRDLQYVALFVPASVLDMGEQGKAYWDISLAALGLKQDVLRAVVAWSVPVITDWVRQNGVVNAKRDNSQGAAAVGGGAAPTSSTAPPLSPKAHDTEERISDQTLEHAISMLIRAAREGHAAAMRELATIYLTLPGIIPPVVGGLGKAGEVISEHLRSSRDRDRSALPSLPSLSDGRRPSEKLGVKIGPLHIGLARYWMEQGRKAGDELAANYLRGKEDCYPDE